MRLCCLWLGQEEAHKQLILNITLNRYVLLSGIFCAGKQVRCHHLLSVCQILAAPRCLFSVAISGTKADLRERSRGGCDIESESQRETQLEYVQMYITPLCPRTCMHLFVFLLSSWIFEQGYVLVTALLSLYARAWKRPSAPITFGYNVTMSVPSHRSYSLLAVVTTEEATQPDTVYDDHFTLTSDKQ